MAAFRRPGETRKAAFGISFETDRDQAAVPPTNNLSPRLDIQEQRRRLPVAKLRLELLYLMEKHATTVVVGETGSGKTTQLPQYLVEAGWAAGGRIIACTQPRRAAAMTVAARVAEEMGCQLGQQVGYSIRFENVSTPDITQIKYCTDGVLLREMMDDPLLSKYSVVMVDEVHERTVATDLLLGLLKLIQKRRPDLRVVISSATLEARKMASFFDTRTVRSGRAAEQGDSPGTPSAQPAIVSVEGRVHTVQVHYASSPVSDYVRAAVSAACDIHREGLPGDILMFLTGQEECERCCSELQDESQRIARKRQYSGAEGATKLLPMPLYAALPAAGQLRAFEAAPRGFRKVVVATNIAETSITIEGVVYVVDCCYAKQSAYDPLAGVETLVTAPISKASAVQRAGRAGRVRPGHCFRLCTEAAFSTLLPDATVPEVQRAELSGIVLQLKALGLHNMVTFPWLSPPPAEAMVRALELLHALHALDASAKLTRPVGMQLAELPVDPPLGAALLAGAQTGCAAEVATVVAMLSVRSVWVGRGDQQGLDEARSRFAVGEGDLITCLNIWEGWLKAGTRAKHWAHANFLNHRALLRAQDIRTQLCRHLRRRGLQVDSAEGNVEKVQRALAKGLCANAVRYVGTAYDIKDLQSLGQHTYRFIRNTGPGSPPQLRIHAQSVLFRTQPACLLFHQLSPSPAAGFHDMSDLLAVPQDWLPEIAPHMYHNVRVDGRAAEPR